VEQLRERLSTRFGYQLVVFDVILRCGRASSAKYSLSELTLTYVDTAAGYGNESGVGRAVVASGLPREDVFVTTKLWNADQGYESAPAACDSSLQKLGPDYIDLYLIHFPAPTRLAYTDTWRALEKLYREGLIRAIGVSNFKFPFLDRLLRTTEIVPAVHQIEVHPTYQQAELDQLSRDHGIVVEAYSPLGRAADLAEPQIGAIAEAHGVTPAQVISAGTCRLAGSLFRSLLRPSGSQTISTWPDSFSAMMKWLRSLASSVAFAPAKISRPSTEQRVPNKE
jgi:hypothetical protein